MARAILVNDKDEVIGAKERADITVKDIQRITGLWVSNSHGEILIARRQLTKKNDPGKWGPAVAGTVDEGETYDSNIVKEAEEEIGLKDIKPVIVKKDRVSTPLRNYFRQMYALKIDKSIEEFEIQQEEVMEIKWISADELKVRVKEHPEEFVASMPMLMELFVK